MDLISLFLFKEELLMDILEDLKWRGLVKDLTNEENIKELLKEPITLYCGFDPTGDSLHVGHLVPLLLLRRFQLAGHHPIAVAGGATAMIGDPSGRSSERNMQTLEEIQDYLESIKKQLSAFLDFGGNNPAQLLNNYDWLSKINIIDYLRTYGKYFTVNYMLAKDVVASRLETGISFTEFSYMTLQSVDFLTLKRDYNCSLQIGGSDQWGNLTAGCDLIRKVLGNESKVEAMTLPLITKSDGTKFGKSAGNAVWLDPKRTSPYEFYQFWINVSDDEAANYLKVFTFLDKEEILEIMEEHEKAPHLRLAQKLLASEMTKIVHGEMALKDAKMITEVLFTGDIKDLTHEQVEMCFAGLESVEVDDSINIVDALIAVNAAKSKREAREFISGNSIAINGEKVTDVEFMVDKEVAFGNKVTVIRRGKKKYFLLRHK